MGINFDAELTIISFVESMLPTFSDQQLGLIMKVNMHMRTWDRNKYDFPQSQIRNQLLFLFVRPDQNTKVFMVKIDDRHNKKGEYPYCKEPFPEPCPWTMISNDHIAWSAECVNILNKIYSEMSQQLIKNKGKDLPDLTEFNYFDVVPKYVRITAMPSANQTNTPFPVLWDLTMTSVERHQLVSPLSAGQDTQHGWLIEGSLDHQKYLSSISTP